MARLAAFLFSGALAAGLVLTLAGCEDDCTTEPIPATEQIQGRITALGIPVDARVIAYPVEDSSGQDCSGPRVMAETDSSGAYQISVTPGRYVIWVTVRTSLCCVSGRLAHGTLVRSNADTLTIVSGGAAVRADLNLGVARIELDVPSALEGGIVNAVLVAQDADADLRIGALAQPADGFAAFYFPAVPSGTYRMQLNNNFMSFWLPGSYAENEGDLLGVGVEAETIYQGAVSGIATLSGTVTGSWQGLNLPRPMLTLFGPDSTVIGRALATNDGAFELLALAPIRARLRIEVDAIYRWEGGNSYAAATEFVLEPERETVVGIVESGIAGELGQGARVYLDTPITLYDGSGNVIGRTGVHGSQNIFFLPNLVPGTYYVSIPRGPTWIEHWYNHADAMDSATPIVVAGEGQVVWIYPELIAGAKISGIILDEGGSPVVGAGISLTTSNEIAWLHDRQTLTRAGGAFDLLAIPDGDYKLGAAVSGGAGTVWYPGTASWDSAGVVTIQAHEDVTGIVIRFPR
jgi:hypothetical protein